MTGMNDLSQITAGKPRKRIAQRQIELRTRLWPTFTDGHVWHRKAHDGYTTIPRTMPLIISIMDDLANGQPVGMTYLELWGRAFDESFVTLSKPREMAFHSGFGTEGGTNLAKPDADSCRARFHRSTARPIGANELRSNTQSIPRNKESSRSRTFGDTRR